MAGEQMPVQPAHAGVHLQTDKEHAGRAVLALVRSLAPPLLAAPTRRGAAMRLPLPLIACLLLVPARVAAGGAWWSRQPLAKPDLPAVPCAAWAKTPIDLFVLAK